MEALFCFCFFVCLKSECKSI